MMHEIRFTDEDRIAVIAPHPDDECIGASAALLFAADRTDIFVISDGSHGCKDRSVEEEAVVRRKQFDAEMDFVKPRSFTWLGVEDTKVFAHPEVFRQIDFTPYTIIFLPWLESLHPDHRYTSAFCLDTIRRQNAQATCYFYEIFAPFHNPTHFIDITGIADKKRTLIRFHEDQKIQEEISLSMNAFRAAQMIRHPDILYAETFVKVSVSERPEAPDLLLKLYGIHDDSQVFEGLAEQGIRIKRVPPMNLSKVYDFIRDSFVKSWADESLPALLNGDCFVAVKDREILGFYAIETPFKNFLGPMGVIPEARKYGNIAYALELTALKAMRDKGYRYAISGMVHPYGRKVEEMACDLIPIPDSAGSYNDMI